MTTDPGDLVLDITCGSGTTAYVAEQWGRRWITCDTSRVAIDLTKQRLMTATYDYYRLAHPEQGVDSGFVYKTVPHITLKSIANNYPPATETLYDQPEIDKTKIRVTGPFTVESLPATTVKPIDGEENEVVSDMTAKQDEYREEILATGVIGKAGEKLEFTRVEAAPATFAYVQQAAAFGAVILRGLRDLLGLFLFFLGKLFLLLQDLYGGVGVFELLLEFIGPGLIAVLESLHILLGKVAGALGKTARGRK